MGFFNISPSLKASLQSYSLGKVLKEAKKKRADVFPYFIKDWWYKIPGRF